MKEFHHNGLMMRPASIKLQSPSAGLIFNMRPHLWPADSLPLGSLGAQSRSKKATHKSKGFQAELSKPLALRTSWARGKSHSCCRSLVTYWRVHLVGGVEQKEARLLAHCRPFFSSLSLTVFLAARKHLVFNSPSQISMHRTWISSQNTFASSGSL